MNTKNKYIWEAICYKKVQQMVRLYALKTWSGNNKKEVNAVPNSQEMNACHA